MRVVLALSALEACSAPKAKLEEPTPLGQLRLPLVGSARVSGDGWEFVSSSSFEDLFGEAAENARDSAVDESWGAELKLAENERWAGRYRGEDEIVGFADVRRVHLLEDFDKSPRFIRGRTKLDRQFDKAAPAGGDTIAIVRLDDIALETGNVMHDYGVAVRSSEAPVPAGGDGIPF